MGDTYIRGPSVALLMNEISDAINGALKRGMATDEICSLVAVVIGDYARAEYGDDYLYGLCKVLLSRVGAPPPYDAANQDRPDA